MLQQHDTAFLLNNFGKMQNWDKKKKKIHQAKIHNFNFILIMP